MLAFYNIGIRLYQFAVFVASFFNPKAKKWLEGRRGLLDTIEDETSEFSGETLWAHCASLGEFEMARPIMESLKESDSSLRIILTFFSPSGYEIRKNYALADHVFYLPLDTRVNGSRFVNAIKPSKVIFVKYDLWFHHLNEAKKQGAKLMLISAQFIASQQYFKFYGATARRALKLFDKVFLVDKNSEKLLHQIDVKNTTVCGDTRYDRVMEIAKKADSISEIKRFKGNSKLIVCGSTWPEDEKILQSALSRFPSVKWIVAPHEVGPKNIERLEMLFPGSVRFSKYQNNDLDVLIIDSIGLLSKVYQYADVAYVGGGFRTGLHNILEATAFGTPTIFGPDYSRFPDAGEMAKNGLAFSIQNENELESKLEELLNSNQSDLKAEILDFMNSRTGATEAILEYTNKC
ncbi:MAG: 3-deoxy-D-manno-octulosonic-acid transferase [Bacteroidia bacterium]